MRLSCRSKHRIANLPEEEWEWHSPLVCHHAHLRYKSNLRRCTRSFVSDWSIVKQHFQREYHNHVVENRALFPPKKKNFTLYALLFNNEIVSSAFCYVFCISSEKYYALVYKERKRTIKSVKIAFCIFFIFVQFWEMINFNFAYKFA